MPDQIETPFITHVVTHGSLNPPEPKEINYRPAPLMPIELATDTKESQPYWNHAQNRWIDPCNNCNNR